MLNSRFSRSSRLQNNPQSLYSDAIQTKGTLPVYDIIENQKDNELYTHLLWEVVNAQVNIKAQESAIKNLTQIPPTIVKEYIENVTHQIGRAHV